MFVCVLCVCEWEGGVSVCFECVFLYIVCALCVYCVCAFFVCFAGSTDSDVVTDSVERGPRVREIGGSVPSRLKQITYKIDTFRVLPSLMVPH